MSTELTAEPGPIPALAGTFVIYEDGKGGYVLVVDVGGEVTHKHIPAAMVKMFGPRLFKMMGG